MNQPSALLRASRASVSTEVRGSRRRPWWPLVIVVAVVAVASPVALVIGSKAGSLLFLGVVGLAVALCGLSSPIVASIFLLVGMFLRTAFMRDVGDVPFLILFVLVVVATVLWLDRTPERLHGIGAVECTMALYVLWNVYSALTPHKYLPGDQLASDPLPNTVSELAVIDHFLVIPTVIPFAFYAVGRFAFDRAAAVRLVLWTILILAAYSGVVSILQFTGPTQLVWPRYIVDSPAWPGRAVGIFNQPVANGIVLALGIAIAMVLISQRSEPAWRRYSAFAIALVCGYGLFLTHTRAAWLSGVLVLVIGAVLARGYRGAFLGVIGLTTAVVAMNWSTFTSSDRQAGGIGSEGEVDDRLNAIQTALWGAKREPLTGWGLDRFMALNTFHHQQWSVDTPWVRGYAIASHDTTLGILAELGVIGLLLWLLVLGLVAYRLWRAYRTLPDDDICGKPLAVIAIMALTIFLCNGSTVDLRFFDFPLMAVFVIFGITVGWSERHKLTQPAARSDAAAGMKVHHV
jgi:O-antigen ligase